MCSCSRGICISSTQAKTKAIRVSFMSLLSLELSIKRKREKKRRCERMEASRGRGGGGGGEVRKLHIVYFLSRNGKSEQPHLIRVHDLSSGGVYLRDVKLWLSELRGGDMPESFAWSYKRKYRAGYVWQDLMDDDLITPISDNEYMLKGSLLPLKNKTTEDLFYLNEQSTQSKEQYPEEDIEDGCTTNMHKTKHETLQIDNTISPKPPSDADQESPVMGTSPSRPDCRTRQTAVFKIDSWREEMKRAEQQRCNEIVVRRKGNRTKGAGCSKVGGDPPSHRRAFKILRNLLKCRRVDIKESALRDTREQDGMIPQSNHRNGGNNSDRKSRERKGSDGWRKEGERASSAMYKPVAEPNCSQCGRPFKPEKLHSHMRSCKALKEKARSRNFNREKVTEQSELASKPGVPKVTVTAL